MNYDNIKLVCLKESIDKENPEMTLSDLGFLYDVKDEYNSNYDENVVDEFVYLIKQTLATKMGDLHRWFGICNYYTYSKYFYKAVEKLLEEYKDNDCINNLNDYIAHRVYELYKSNETIHDIYYKTCVTHKMIDDVIFENIYDFDYSDCGDMDTERRFYKAKHIVYKKNVYIDNECFDFVFYKDDKAIFALEYKYNEILYEHDTIYDYGFLDIDDDSIDYNYYEEKLNSIIDNFECFDIREWLHSFDYKNTIASNNNIYYIIVDDMTYNLKDLVHKLYYNMDFVRIYMDYHINKVNKHKMNYKEEDDVKEDNQIYYLCDVRIKDKKENFCYLSRDGMLDEFTKVIVPLKDELVTGIVFTCKKCKGSELPFDLSRMRYIESVVSLVDGYLSLGHLYEIRHGFEHRVLPELFYTDTESFINHIIDDYSYLNHLYVKHFHDNNIYNVDEGIYEREVIDVSKDLKVIKIKCPEPTKKPLCYYIVLVYLKTLDCIQYFCIEKTYKYPALCSWSIDAKHLVYGLCDEDEELYVDCCIDMFIEEHVKEEELMN